MLELKGKYGDAKVFTDNIDQETISQVIGLLNQPYAAESKIRIMPDCHGETRIWRPVSKSKARGRMFHKMEDIKNGKVS